MEEKRCPNCGAMGHGRFCGTCGTPMNLVPPSPAPQQAPPQVPGYQAPVAPQSYSQPTVVSAPPQKPPKKKSKAPLLVILILLALVVLSAGGFGIYTRFVPRTHVVEFDPNGGKIISGEDSQEIAHGKDAVPPEVQRNGWLFEEWDRDYTNIKKDTTVTATWTKGVTITFDIGDGRVDRGETELTLKPGSTVTPPEVSRPGYSFEGWDPAITDASEDTVYTALWKATEYDSQTLYEVSSPSVVEIHMFDQRGAQYSQGSGFFVENDSTVATNYHVIEAGSSGEILTADGKTYEIKKVLGWDKELDLALLECDSTGIDPLPISQHEVVTGEAVYTLGSALGLTGTISDGIVSTSSREIDGVDCIQITAPISPGNSGGPLLNRFGEVIGINTMYFERGQNLNFSVNIHLLDQLDLSNPVTMEEFFEVTFTEDTDYMSDEGAVIFEITDESEQESNNTPETANILHPGTSLGGYVSPSDWDLYSFSLSTSGSVAVALASYYDEDISYLYGVIFDEELNPVVEMSVSEQDDIELQMAATELPAGTYYVYVGIDTEEDYPFTTGAFYALIFDTSENGIDVFSSNIDVGPEYPDDEGASVFTEADDSERERNDQASAATPIYSDRFMAGYCDENDVDYFTFTLTESGSIDLSIFPYYEEDYDYVTCTLYDDAGNSIAELSYDGVYFDTQQSLSAGTYYILVTLKDGYYPYTVGSFYKLLLFY